MRIPRAIAMLCAWMNQARPRVLLYTKRWCVSCLAARRLFRRLEVPFEEVSVDRNPEIRRQASVAAGGWPTVPMVFIDGTFIGGYREARALHERGALDAMLDPGRMERT